MSDRFVRQADFIPQERLAEEHVTIIGIGAIGRQIGLQLASIGARKLTLIDHDRVELSNTTTQSFRCSDIGMLKVDAMRQAIGEIDPTVHIETVADRFRTKHAVSESVFCAVDSIAAREAIWKSLKAKVQFFCDSRMRGEILRTVTATDLAGREHYGSTLFPQAEAQVGACTARSTIYCAAIAAGIALHQYARWLRSIPCEKDLVLSLLAAELTPS